jgi:hypothetical protein
LNQGPVDTYQLFNRDYDRGRKFAIKVRLKNKNRSLPRNFQSGSDEKIQSKPALKISREKHENPCTKREGKKSKFHEKMAFGSLVVFHTLSTAMKRSDDG